MLLSRLVVQSNNHRCLNRIVTRYLGFERAGKSVKPGVALVLEGVPHRITKITQGDNHIIFTFTSSFYSYN